MPGVPDYFSLWGLPLDPVRKRVYCPPGKIAICNRRQGQR
jgi:hypothetical protein